ncbi:MAG: Npt1/Npt2 family nucleotide transporter, partial [Desulfobacterales bacterium]
MIKILGKWFKIYEGEIGLFLWIVALLFLVRSSGILLNNYAETAFLKRYGVEYLPIVNMINAVATFFIMGVIAGIMGRLPGARLLFYLFLFCGVSVGGIRFLIPFGIDLIYPVLFMLKAQYEVLLALLFWNLANDLFNTRQSKRLFPLVTAGGVIGQILGSFGTPFLARTLSFDNLLLAYLATCLLGAAAVKGMGAHFPTLLLSDKKRKKTRSGTKMFEQFRNILPLMKESTLIKILILLTFVPNVVIPIMNYQFNFAVNEQFATETSMIQFFSYFRGVLNIISLIILLFVGRIYGRWGLPVALMFHPFNYMLAFLAFLFRFDYFSAMYARMSSNILRTTINIPANAILMGLFPEAYRGMVRPFLRGTVVRIGLLLGSGMILLSEPLFHPRYLSLVAIPFVIVWIITPFILKKNYAKILLDLVSGNMLDIKNMEAADVGQIFKDKTIEDRLIQEFLSTSGDDCLWYAGLLKSLSLKDLDRHILARLSDLDDRTRIGLLDLLSPQAGKEAVPVLKGVIDPKKPDLMLAIVKAANRLDPAISAEFDLEAFN